MGDHVDDPLEELAESGVAAQDDDAADRDQAVAADTGDEQDEGDDGPRPARVPRVLVVSLSGAIVGWGLGWDFGAFGFLVGYRRENLIAVASFVVLLVSLIHPSQVRIGWVTRAMLALPAVSMLLLALSPDELWRGAITPANVGDISIGWLLGLLVITIVYLVSLPFLLYALGRLLGVGIFDLRRREQLVCAIIVVGVTVLGAAAGANHPRLVTCDNFARHGDYQPADCTR